VRVGEEKGVLNARVETRNFAKPKVPKLVFSPNSTSSGLDRKNVCPSKRNKNAGYKKSGD